jgi:mRNA deadenylase 3'-5' endonuclease subunit Ccr4
VDPKDAPWTTYKLRDVELRRTIDYIWYCTPQHGTTTKNNYELVLTDILEIPPHEVFPHRLPAVNFPSDHLNLCARFALVQSTS